MKKVKLSAKLNLNKQTVVKLNDFQMNAINGGTGGRTGNTVNPGECKTNTTGTTASLDPAVNTCNPAVC